jgi:hypothetical protein
VTVPIGPLEIDTDGPVVSTVQLRLAGAPMFPRLSRPLTAKLWDPSVTV